MSDPLLGRGDLSPDELHRLEAFRATAAEVHRIYGPLHAVPVKLRMLRADKADEAELLPRDALRSLGIAVRQAYMSREEGSFEGVANILERVAHPDVKEHLARIRADWRHALTGFLHIDMGGDQFSPKRLLDTWLYALTVHRDRDKQEAADRLREVGAMASWGLELTVRRLSIAIINLDGLLAVVAGEPLLPPLGGDDDDARPDWHF